MLPSSRAPGTRRGIPIAVDTVVMPESSTAARRRARRIPDEVRKRSAQSCDRCRKRRCRCVRSPSGHGCVPCEQANTPCSYTAPRKTRFYGSVEELSDRYRCLDAIVRAKFPNDGVDSASDLVRLGHRIGVLMPDITSPNRPEVSMGELAQASRQLTPPPSASGSSMAAPQSQSSQCIDTSSHEHGDTESSMIKDASGREHYIGPSGTLNFLHQLRHLVDSHRLPGQGLTPTTDGVAKFTGDVTAQALEAGDDAPEQGPGRRDGESVHPDGVSPSSATSAIARDFACWPAIDMDEAIRQFPPNHVLEMLIHSYFKTAHDDFPLFHRATFEDECELFIVRVRQHHHAGQQHQHQPALAPPRQCPRPDWGWIGCLHMVIVFGSITNQAIPGVDHAQQRKASVAVARSLLPQLVSKCALANVRVLLLLALFLHNNNERNAAWTLVGTAARISYALGLHRSDVALPLRSPLEREGRRLVFCTLYAFDQFLGISLGRPSGLHEADVEVVAPRGGFLDGGDAGLLSWSLRLQMILGRTRLMYLPRAQRESISIPAVGEILDMLRGWKTEIVEMVPGLDIPSVELAGVHHGTNEPGGVGFEELKASLAWKTRSQLRAVLLMHIQFHYIAVVATRTILLRDVSSQKSAMVTSSEAEHLSPHANTCVRHACQLCYLVLLLDHFDVINGLTGLDVFYSYCAAMILILRLLWVPRAGETSAGGRGDDEMLLHLRHLVTTIREVINRADKSGSMKRFARVVDTFAGCIDPVQQQQQLQQDLTSACAAAPPQDGTQGYSVAESQLGLEQMGAMDCAASRGMVIGPAMGSSQMLEVFPFMTPGTTMGGMNMAVAGEGNMPISDWCGLELFLAGYGGASA